MLTVHNDRYSSYKVLATNDDVNFSVMPGDSVTLLYTDKEGVTHTLESVQIDKAQRITSAMVVEFTNMFGLKSGLAAVVGERYAPPEIPPGGFILTEADPHLPAMLPNKEIEGLTKPVGDMTYA